MEGKNKDTYAKPKHASFSECLDLCFVKSFATSYDLVFVSYSNMLKEIMQGVIIISIESLHSAYSKYSGGYDR